ncbi:MAG: hypothetical protein K8R63_10360 [Bacteroidales bacterium]|nr:hypothetical protein [Bacteroidales bacterium]
MNTKISLTNRRIGMTLNYLSLAAIVFLFEFYKDSGFPVLAILAISGAILVWLISFILTYIRTQAWKQVHRSFKKLDEREAGQIYESLRVAYGIFTVIALAVLFVYSLTELQVSIIVFVSLLYLAHVLPASFIVWKK